MQQSKLVKMHHSPVSAQFPGKLHDMITFAEGQGLEHIISFVQGGTAIMVHDSDKLLELLPHFGFSQTQYRSFQRQLNMWHFERVLEGRHRGAWKHPYFLRGNKSLCSLMSRSGIPTKAEVAQKLAGLKIDSLQTNIPVSEKNPENNLSIPDKVCHIFPQQAASFLPSKSKDVYFSLPSTQWDDICSTDVTKLICSMDDSWTPLPVDSPSLDESFNSVNEEMESTQHVVSALFPMVAEDIVEPTPLREPSYAVPGLAVPESVMMSQLLEPISTLDDIF